MDQSDTTQPAAIEDMANGYKKLTVFGVTVKATGTPSLWPAMERLAEAINIAAEHRGVSDT